MTERLTEQEEWHRETRTNGHVDSSEGERQERVKERTVTQAHQAGSDDGYLTGRMGRDDDVPTRESPESELGDHLGGPALEQGEKEAVQEIALEEGEWDDGRPGDSFTIPVVRLVNRASEPLTALIFVPQHSDSRSGVTLQELPLTLTLRWSG